MFPTQTLIETVLTDILDRRFKASGQIVKYLLLTEHDLERHFEFLSQVYLFKEDFLFFLYQRLFRQVIIKIERNVLSVLFFVFSLIFRHHWKTTLASQRISATKSWMFIRSFVTAVL